MGGGGECMGHTLKLVSKSLVGYILLWRTFTGSTKEGKKAMKCNDSTPSPSNFRKPVISNYPSRKPSNNSPSSHAKHIKKGIESIE